MVKGRNYKLGIGSQMTGKNSVSKVKACSCYYRGPVFTNHFKEGILLFSLWQRSCCCTVATQVVDEYTLMTDQICGPTFSQVNWILWKCIHTRETNGPSSSSVVTWVIRAKFLTSPQASPSGVSHGQSIPHCNRYQTHKYYLLLQLQNPKQAHSNHRNLRLLM